MKYIKTLEYSVVDFDWDPIETYVWESIEGSVQKYTDTYVRDSVEDSVWNSLWKPVWNSIQSFGSE